MAITDTELNISNKSYTNKDFAAIYDEILEYGSKISKRFNPSYATESDPIIMTLKLLAFVSDKVNYNLDKNILEAFMSSATQDMSMRELTERMGYNMHYYISSSTNVVFKYRFTSEDTVDRIIVPQYSIVKNDTDDVQFITMETTSIDRSTGLSTEVEVRQGILKSMTVLGSNKIQLENLDYNRRLYFPESMIAQNGVIIEGGSSNIEGEWEVVDNLNLQGFGSKVVKFGYDSKNGLPYIEFPEWISDIIGDGLSIRYLVTSGVDGNVNARALTSVERMWNASIKKSDSVEDSAITVVNSNSASSGDNPESIDDAYQGFKKTIGTFDTLVTCRDYANAIYNLLDANGNRMVSNAQVADRRTDINYGSNVATFTEDGLTTLYVEEPTKHMTAHELSVYPLKAVKDIAFSNLNKSLSYNNTFSRASLTDEANIKARLENGHTMSQDYIDLQDNDIFLVKIKYKLDAIISTSSKVNAIEQIDILNNVNEALAKAYNSSKLEYGYEIPYDDIQATIENADVRIKSVALYEPEQTPVIVTANGNEYDDSSDVWMRMNAKNILSGNVPMYDYHDEFSESYSEVGQDEQQRVYRLTTLANIPQFQQGVSEFTIPHNVAVQFMAPSFVTDSSTYGYGINYYLDLGQDSDTKFIPHGQEYRLTQNQFLVFAYVSGGEMRIVEYKSGDIVKSENDLYDTNYRATPREEYSRGETPTKKDIKNNDFPTKYDGKPFFTLGSSDSIVHRKINEETLGSKVRCYWHLNSLDNELFNADRTEYILEEGEYFFYSDVAMTYVEAFGSGTRLRLSYETSGDNWRIDKIDDISILTEDGLSSFKDNFKLIEFSSENDRTLNIQEQQIITLTENDAIRLTNTGIATIQNNEFDDMSNTSLIEYRFSDTDSEAYTPLPTFSGLGVAWKARALLDIDAGFDKIQNLSDNQSVEFWTMLNKASTDTYQANTYYSYSSDKGYSLMTRTSTPSDWSTGNYYKLSDKKTVDASRGEGFKFNIYVQKAGGNDMVMHYIDINLTAQLPDLLICKTPVLDIQSLGDGLYKAPFTDVVKSVTTEIPCPTVNLENAYYPIFMVYVKSYGATVTLGSTSNANEFHNLTTEPFSSNWYSSWKKTCTLNDGVNIILCSNANSKGNSLKFSYTATDGSIPTMIFTDVRLVNSESSYPKVNGLLDISKNLVECIDFMVSEYPEAYKRFYQCCKIDPSKEIELSDACTLSNAQAFYDSNNIANGWSLPYIDFEESNITIARSSTK